VFSPAPLQVGATTVLFLTAAAFLLRADTAPPAPSPGYHLVRIGDGDKPTYIQVKNDVNPYANVSSPGSSDKYRPDEMSFSAQSPLANKTFSSGSASTHKSDAAGQRTFVTKSYLGDSQAALEGSISDPTAKTQFATASAYGKNAAGFDKSFSSSSFDTGSDKTVASLAARTSPYQGREASINSEKPEVFADSSLATKQYLGPGAQHVPDGITVKENVLLTRMSGVPDRPLTIDEVRELINHDVTPDPTAKPPPATKPLNDPAYKRPVRPAPPEEDDKNDPVPPPGMMAAPSLPPPENSEPLPH
jgi:hypothetical protein